MMGIAGIFSMDFGVCSGLSANYRWNVIFGNHVLTINYSHNNSGVGLVEAVSRLSWYIPSVPTYA